MGAFYDEIPEKVVPFIRRQKIFFVATAPLNGGTVNTSPKCADGCMQLVSNKRFRYTDLTGSGNETISHVLEPGNGRITIMFIAWEGTPQIVRLFGKATVYERFDESPKAATSEAPSYLSFYPPIAGHGELKAAPPGTRAVIDVAIFQCSTSCGYSVPFFQYLGPRATLHSFHDKREHNKATKERQRLRSALGLESGDDPCRVIGTEGHRREARTDFEAYVARANALSLDGLPGLRSMQGAMIQADQERLARVRQSYDAFAPPPLESAEELGPFRPEAPCFYRQAQNESKAGRLAYSIFPPTTPLFTFLLGVAFAIVAQYLLRSWKLDSTISALLVAHHGGRS